MTSHAQANPGPGEPCCKPPEPLTRGDVLGYLCNDDTQPSVLHFTFVGGCLDGFSAPIPLTINDNCNAFSYHDPVLLEGEVDISSCADLEYWNSSISLGFSNSGGGLCLSFGGAIMFRHVTGCEVAIDFEAHTGVQPLIPIPPSATLNPLYIEVAPIRIFLYVYDDSSCPGVYDCLQSLCAGYYAIITE